MLDRSTVIKLNEDELLPVVEIEDPGEAAGRLLDRGASLALVSMGPEGSVLRHSDVPGRGTVIRIERVVDPTGAGDAFLAGRLTHLWKALGGPTTTRPCARRCVGERQPVRWPARSSVRCRGWPRGRSSSASWPLGPEHGRVSLVLSGEETASG